MKEHPELQRSFRPMVGRQRSFTLITGGTRSGKSRFAVALAKRLGHHVAYIATCGAADQEMYQRIARHRHARPKHWKTIEHPPDPAKALIRLNGKVRGAIIDCLTMYVSDLLVQGHSNAVIQQKVRRLCKAVRTVSYPVLMVTNEVGSSVVPEYELGRRFRDLAGLANQIAAGFADHVFLLVAGIPLQVKGAKAPCVESDGTVASSRREHPRA